MVTISCAEYEEFQTQRKKISELECRVALLMEALRLVRHKQFGASSQKSEDTLSPGRDNRCRMLGTSLEEV